MNSTNNPIKHIPYLPLKNSVINRLMATGFSQEQAEIEAEIMMQADQREVPSHGLIMLPRLLGAVESKKILPASQAKTLMQFSAICIKDYGNGPGRVASMDAMKTAMSLAKQFGIGFCLAKNTTHWGRAAPYLEKATEENFIAICATNAIPSMAVGAANHPVLGNNPLGIGVPGNPPVILDMALSEAAKGKIATYLREGKTIPEHWHHQPNESGDSGTTENETDILGKTLAPLSGHKGTGLSIILELLTSALTGGPSSPAIGGEAQAGIDTGSSKFFIAINLEKFVDIKTYQSRINEFIEYLKNEASPVYFPGERSAAAKEKNQQTIPLHDDIIQALREHGVAITV